MRSSLREYLKRAHGIDESWYQIDRLNGSEFVKTEVSSRAIWYVPTDNSFLKNIIYGKKIHSVFNNILRIMIKKDIFEIYPESMFYGNFEPQTPIFASFDEWLDIEKVDSGGIRGIGDRVTGLWIREKDGGQEYHIDFPLLSYIDHIYVDAQDDDTRITRGTLRMRRGFFRAWILISGLWVILIFVFASIAFYGEEGTISKSTINPILGIAFIPPIILLIAGACVAWVLSGFRR